jgi:hypothetical protein
VEEAEQKIYPERPRAAVEVNCSLGVCFAYFFVQDCTSDSLHTDWPILAKQLLVALTYKRFFLEEPHISLIEYQVTRAT